jgi:hypothetical protein
MADEPYRFCKIFLCAAEPRSVMDLLAVLLGGDFQRGSLALPSAVVDVLRNPDAGSAEDFIGWPTFVEIEADADADNASIVEVTSRIVIAMWGAGIPAVAACDYEDELPWRGGISRISEPGTP